MGLPDLYGGGKFLDVTIEDNVQELFMIGTYRVPRGYKLTLFREKIMSSTQINGRDGTIKEVSGFSDWNLSLEFLFLPAIGLGHNLTLSELDDVNTLFGKLGSFFVVNTKLNLLGIRRIVLTKLELPDPDRNFELPCRLYALSDSYIDLEEMPIP